MHVTPKTRPWKEKPTTNAGLGWSVALPAITAALTALQTIVVAVFGYVLTGKLELTLKERALTVTNVNSMAMLVQAMYGEDVTADTRRRTVQHLAMYQRDAIGPLLILAANQNPFPAEIPLEGLKFVALQYQSDVCNAVSRALATKDIVFEKSLDPLVRLHTALNCQG